MSGLKKIKDRISSATSTKKITKTMQMISAAKLQKLKANHQHSVYNANLMSDIFEKVFYYFQHSDFYVEHKKLFSNDKSKGVLVILFTSDRGLCGASNNAVIKYLKSDITNIITKNRNVKLLVVGKKGFNVMKKGYFNVMLNEEVIPNDHSGFSVQFISNMIKAFLIEHAFQGECIIYYNEFKNMLTQLPTKKRLFPLFVESDIDDNRAKPSIDTNFTCESINMDSLINLYMYDSVYSIILESNMSEEGARMTAMDSATKNAEEFVSSLQLSLNRSRQKIITTELIEVISGVEVQS